MPGFDGGCVFSCRHNVWGGNGTCMSIQEADSIEYECSCGDGYVSKDSFGLPSCVWKLALVGLYTAVAVFGAVTVGFLRWTVINQRRLSTTAQATRRAKLRIRLINSASAYSGSSSIVFLVAVPFGNLYDSGMLMALYCVTMPLVMMAVADMLDVWIDTLPSQLLPADSVAVKVMKLAEEKRAFFWVGRVSSGGFAAFALSAFFFIDASTVVRCINLTTGTFAGCAFVCFNFVGFHLTGIINNAKRQASPSALAFYSTAIHTLRVQVVALSFSAVLWVFAVVGLEPQLGGASARTPIFPLSIMIIDAYAGFSLAVHCAKVGAGRGAPASPGRTSPIVTRMKATRAIASDIGGENRRSLFGGGRFVAASTTMTTTVKAVSMPASAAVSGQKRVAPTSGGGEG